MQITATSNLIGPYEDQSTNLIYNLLFCDNSDLFEQCKQKPCRYPWDILLAEHIDVTDLQKVIDDPNLETRHKVLAHNILKAKGYHVDKGELLAVIVEVGLDEGLDVLASYKDGRVRYVNQTGKIIFWDTTNPTSSRLIEDLFAKSKNIVDKIGPSDTPRTSYPEKGFARLTFLVSNGRYYGEGPIDALFMDPLTGPALNAATALLMLVTGTV